VTRWASVRRYEPVPARYEPVPAFTSAEAETFDLRFLLLRPFLCLPSPLMALDGPEHRRRD
jgi:hypothetical protein